MNLDLSGKTALVCGSTQGLGYASAVELAALGCHVVLMARNEEKLKASLLTLANNGMRKHAYIVADFNDTAVVKNAIEKFVEHQPVHILINNTGGPGRRSCINCCCC